ncbi:helix-turn-helix domain-containing protein [Mesorhizobium sp.]|uniref:helix-turn-helix domain-containing protein n=1 Tax=Mesorhizobium sp. TaxID=1871066 RepID=UPI000FE9382B|nr:helix-turn-helix domain-containing protein [Mesorhizobium sp.]RWB67586.1 MAG: helix-turn-helix domain-containing protein [Mesorhizobium sp.]
MSHAATNWAITQRGLKPATRVVLWHLCDRHHPDNGCFPSQDRLAHDCEMSRSALNQHLNLLEFKHRIISRKQKVNDRGQQENTQYKFAFEEDFRPTQDVVGPSPESGHGAVSGKSLEPCPEKTENRVRNPDTNPVREPVREPPVRAGAREGEGRDFDILWDGWPSHHRPDSRDAASKLFTKLVQTDRAKALAGAPHYLKAMTNRNKPPRMVTYLRDHLFADFHDGPEIDNDGLFVIRPKMPEWGPWLGAVRREFGESGVQTTLRTPYMLRKTRWPTDLPLASRVTNLAPSATGSVADSRSAGGSLL